MARRSSDRGRHLRSIALLLGILGVGVKLHAQQVQIKIKVFEWEQWTASGKELRHRTGLGEPGGIFC